MTQDMERVAAGRRSWRRAGGLIHIFPSLVAPADASAMPSMASVFVSLGAGETHVTILDAEGACTRGWTAVFGWSALCTLPFVQAGKIITFDEEVLVAKALTGSVRLYGKPVDTSSYLEQSADLMRDALEEILTRTIGAGAAYDAIVLAAPGWMQEALRTCLDLRPHILPEIREL